MNNKRNQSNKSCVATKIINYDGIFTAKIIKKNNEIIKEIINLYPNNLEEDEIKQIIIKLIPEKRKTRG